MDSNGCNVNEEETSLSVDQTISKQIENTNNIVTVNTEQLPLTENGASVESEGNPNKAHDVETEELAFKILINSETEEKTDESKTLRHDGMDVNTETDINNLEGKTNDADYKEEAYITEQCNTLTGAGASEVEKDIHPAAESSQMNCCQGAVDQNGDNMKDKTSFLQSAMGHTEEEFNKVLDEAKEDESELRNLKFVPENTSQTLYTEDGSKISHEQTSKNHEKTETIQQDASIVAPDNDRQLRVPNVNTGEEELNPVDDAIAGEENKDSKESIQEEVCSEKDNATDPSKGDTGAGQVDEMDGINDSVSEPLQCHLEERQDVSEHVMSFDGGGDVTAVNSEEKLPEQDEDSLEDTDSQNMICGDEQGGSVDQTCTKDKLPEIKHEEVNETHGDEDLLDKVDSCAFDKEDLKSAKSADEAMGEATEEVGEAEDMDCEGPSGSDKNGLDEIDDRAEKEFELHAENEIAEDEGQVAAANTTDQSAPGGSGILDEVADSIVDQSVIAAEITRQPDGDDQSAVPDEITRQPDSEKSTIPDGLADTDESDSNKDVEKMDQADEDALLSSPVSIDTVDKVLASDVADAANADGKGLVVDADTTDQSEAWESNILDEVADKIEDRSVVGDEITRQPEADDLNGVPDEVTRQPDTEKSSISDDLADTDEPDSNKDVEKMDQADEEAPVSNPVSIDTVDKGFESDVDVAKNVDDKGLAPVADTTDQSVARESNILAERNDEQDVLDDQIKRQPQADDQNVVSDQIPRQPEVGRSSIPDDFDGIAEDDTNEEQEKMGVTDEEAILSSPVSKMNPDHLLSIGMSLEKLRIADQLCDFTINVNVSKFRAHKVILCASSPYLHNLITEKETGLSELKITSDISPTAVEVFIHYLYTGELQLKDVDLTEVEKLASQYDVGSLKTVLSKTYDSGTGELKLRSVHTQTSSQTDKFDVLSKPISAKTRPVVSARKNSTSYKTETSKVKAASVDKDLRHKVTPDLDDESRLLESDDDNDVGMDCGDNDIDDDLLNESPVHTHAVSSLSRSAKNDLAHNSKLKGEQITTIDDQSIKDPQNIQEKALSVQVRVEKLPPNIKSNVTVVVNDSDSIKDSEIEFIAEKSNDHERNGTDFSKKQYTLEEKEQIALEAKRRGTTQTSRAKNIPLPDILSWMTFFGLRKASDNVNKKYGKQVNHEAELSIVRWIVQQQELNGNVDLDAMRNYSLAVYRQSQPTFVASKTWLANFFKRNISLLQGTNFIHGGEEGETKSEPVPVKLTQLPYLVDPTMASIESQVNDNMSDMSEHSSDHNIETMGYSATEHIAETVGEMEISEQTPQQQKMEISDQTLQQQDSANSIIDPQTQEDVLSKSSDLENTANVSSNTVTPSDNIGLGGISKELLAKIRSKPLVIGTAVTFDAKTERRLAEWLIEKQKTDGYVYRDDFISYAKSVHKGHRKFQGTQGWVQLFMRRNGVKMPELKRVRLKSKFKTFYTDEEKVAIVQQARKLGVPHVSKMLRINSSVIHSWKMGMDAEERKKGGPKNYEKVTRSVSRAFPSVSKEVDEIIDNSLKERIKARIDIESKRRSSANANRGPDPELEREAIEKIKEVGIVRYQDVQKICYEVYSRKRPEFQASRSWVLKFVNNHILGLEEVELLKSWLVYPERNQLRLKYEDKINILEEEKKHGVEETAKMRNVSCGTIRFWKKYPPSPEDDKESETQSNAAADVSSNRKVQTNDYEYVPSKFQAGKKVRRRVVIGDAVMFTPEQELQLVQWIHDNMLADNSVYTDDFRQYAKSLYNGRKAFSASSTWLYKFVRRNPILRGVQFISKYKRYFTEEEKYAAVMEARRFGTTYVAKKLNSDSGLINSWKIKFAKYSVKKMARLKQSTQLDRAPLQNLVIGAPITRPPEIENPDMTLEEIEKEVGSGLHSYKGEIPVFEREIVQLVKDEDKDKGGVTYEDISRLCRSVYERTRPHFKASQNWTRDFIKRHEEALNEVNILNKKKLFIDDDDEPLNASTSQPYRRNRNLNAPAEVSPVLQKIMSKKPILLGQSRTLEPKMEKKLVQWMVQKQAEDGYVFVDEFNEYAKSLYSGTKKFAATQAWRILFFKRNKAALKHVKLESKYRKQFTREEKLAIVAEARRLGIGHVARKIDVNSSLIYSWGFGKTPQLTQDELANEKIEQDVGKGLYSQRGTIPTLENEIIKCIHEKQKEGSVSYDDISKICLNVYKETRPNFKASYNWTMEFIKRHKKELIGVDIENMKKVYYENDDEEQPGLQSFINTLNQNMDTNVSDSLVQIENLEHGPDIDFHAHSYEESDLNLNDIIDSGTSDLGHVKQEPMEHTGEEPADDEASSAAILERIRASKPEIIGQPKTFDLEVEKKMVKWLVEKQAQDGYVFTDDFVEYAKSLYTGSESFSASQTWRKNFLRRHRAEVNNILFRSKHVNQYTEVERQMVVEEARKYGVAHVAKQCGLDPKLVWSWKVRADQDNKAKQNAFWKGPKKTTSTVSKPLHIKQAVASPAFADSEPLGDAYRGIVPEFEDRIIKDIIEYQNREGSISYEEISEISRNIYQETKPNFKAGYGWIKNFLQRHKSKLKNIDIENMKKLYLPGEDAFVPASGKNIREVSGLGPNLGTTNLGNTIQPLNSDDGTMGDSLESLQKLIAKKPIVLGVPKSFNAKTEKKLVQWLLDQQAQQGYAFLDEFKEYASSLYTGHKKFAATNAWRTQFFRRNHSALKHVKLVSKFRKTFTEEEKIAIVREAKRLGVGHVSRQLDIGHGNINVWMRELESKGRISSGIIESPVMSESSNSSFTSVKGKRKSVERSSTDSRQSSRERTRTAEENQEENETGSGLYSARGIVPIFEKQIVEEVLEYYRVNESIKYDDISRISQNIYKETRPTFKASHNWIKDFLTRHAEKLGHLIIQNAREFLTQKEKREVLAEVEKHGLHYVSKVTNISQAQLLAWKEQLKNAPPLIPTPPSTPSTPTQTAAVSGFTSATSPVSTGNTMFSTKARKYSVEEKKMYADECEKHGMAYVSSHYGIARTNLGRWVKMFNTPTKEPLDSDTKSKAKPNDTRGLDGKVVNWVLERGEEIGVVVVTHLMDFAQEALSECVPSFQASEEWLSNFIAYNNDTFKQVKFRYPEEVTTNKLNFTQQQKDKLCEVSNIRPVAEVATMAGIYPYTLYDWRKHYKRKQLKTASESLGTGQMKSPPELLVPKTEAEESDGKSKMQEKLARIESKYNAIQKQEIADEARKDGTTATAKKRGIPLPLVLKWMKAFPETVPVITSPKPVKSSKSGSGSRSRSVESTPKLTVRTSPSPKPKSGNKASEPKKDTGLKVKLPAPTKKPSYNSKLVTPEERRKFVMEFREEGPTAVSARTGIPKSTLYAWSKALETSDAASETSRESGKNAMSSESLTSDINVKKEAIDIESFTVEKKKEIAFETKSLGFEETAKKRGLPTAVVIEWMGLYLDQSPTGAERELPTTTAQKSVTPKKVYTEEEKCKLAEQALEIGSKETAKLTGVHVSIVTRWMNTYKKRFKGRQSRHDTKDKSQDAQNKSEKRHQMIQGIMKENAEGDKKKPSVSRSSSVNSESDASADTITKPAGEFSFEDKLRVLQAADEIGVRSASVKFKVDQALIFQWRRLYDYTDVPKSVATTPSATVTSLPTDSIGKSKSASTVPTSTPEPNIASSSHNVTPSFAFGSNEFDSIVISDDEGSCSPCSNHSWQSDEGAFDTPRSASKRKSDFSESDLGVSAKRNRPGLNQSFGVEDDVASDVIDFAYTPEQKQAIVRESSIYGLEKVSSVTNIPVSLIIAWKSQFPVGSSVKTEKF